jgi:hypothetical protein
VATSWEIDSPEATRLGPGTPWAQETKTSQHLGHDCGLSRHVSTVAAAAKDAPIVDGEDVSISARRQRAKFTTRRNSNGNSHPRCACRLRS